MKQVILILIVLISFDSHCQNYQSIFGENSTLWNQCQESIGYVNDITIELGGDSVINENEYKALMLDNSIVLDSTFFLREDTVQGKAWILDSDNEKEYLIMDLSLEKGDTFMMAHVFDYQDSLAIVDTVYFVDGAKHIELDYDLRIENNEKKLCFMEGIGPNAGILYQVYSIDDNIVENNFLLCCYQDGELTFRDTANSSESCTYISDVYLMENIDSDMLQCYPNPTIHGKLYITTNSEKNGKVEIIDMFGKMIISTSLDINGSAEVDVDSFKAGTYIILLKSNKELIDFQEIQIF